VELERRVVRHDAVRGELSGHLVGIDGVALGVGTTRHGRVQAAPQVQQPAGGHVLLQHRSGGLPAPAATRGVGRCEIVETEHRVAVEVVGGLHLLICHHSGSHSARMGPYWQLSFSGLAEATKPGLLKLCPNSE
jgi:hypothetical protein